MVVRHGARERELKRLNVFQNKCLRTILRVFYPNKISNKDLMERTGVEEIIRRRRLRYFGHLIRSENELGKTAVN